MFFMDIIKLVIKIKIQLTFLIKFCVTDLAVSTSVIVNMSRFIPRNVLDHNGHSNKNGRSQRNQTYDVVE